MHRRPTVSYATKWQGDVQVLQSGAEMCRRLTVSYATKWQEDAQANSLCYKVATWVIILLFCHYIRASDGFQTFQNANLSLSAFAFSSFTKASRIKPTIKKTINEIIARRAVPVICLTNPNVKGPQIAENLLKTEKNP